MAQGKKKIIFYADWQDSFEELTDEEAGVLIKHFFKYINDENPVLEDRVLKATWIPIEKTLKRDLVKWSQKAEQSRLNGARGGRPKKPKETQKTQQVILEPKKPVNDNVSVSVNVIDSVNDILLEKETKKVFKEWLEYRKEIKKPIKSERTLKILAEKMQTEGAARSKEVVNNSIQNQWQGLFWDKKQVNGSKKELDAATIIQQVRNGTYENR